MALDDFLVRIRMRRYPETIPVLASYWLKAIHSAGHNLAWWFQLNNGITRILRELAPGDLGVESLYDVQSWVRQDILRKHKAPAAQPQASPPFRSDLTSAKEAADYVCRLLNDWMPREVARLLTGELEHLLPENDGMPCLAVGKAIERLLHRERFSPQSLELLLQTATVHADPAHAEILRDVVLAMLGRTSPPAAPVLPAALLAIAGHSTASAQFGEAVERAFLVQSGGIEELYVPLEEAQAMEFLERDPGRIGSILVTADGRWWQSERLQGPAESAIVFRPGGLLRIDYTSNRATLVVPWPESETDWRGDVRLPQHLAIFGREWRARAWEKNAERAWLRLDFSRSVTAAEGEERPPTRARGLRPASIEMAWSEVEQALATAHSHRSTAPFDQLRREDLIPLARAILRLTDSVLKPSLHRREEIERSLASIRYHHGAVAPAYGHIPWRVLPEPLRDALRKRRLDEHVRGLLAEIFEDAPGPVTGRSSPPRAA